MPDFLMPKLSDTMEEGTILQWMKSSGDVVEKGEAVVEIETDKANMTVEAPEGGTLQIVADIGDTLPVGARIATIGEGIAPVAPQVEDRDEETGGIPTADDGTGVSIGRELEGTEDYPGARDEEEQVTAEVVPEPAPPPAQGDGGERVKASPLARRLARELGVDIAQVHGTGPGGRIVRADVEAASRGEDGAVRTAPAPAAAPPAASPPAEPAPAPADGERVPLTRLQQTVARRMALSKPGAPHFYLERDVDATAASALRRELVAAAPEGRGPSLNDLVVRAVAMAAAERPDAISRFDGDALVTPSGVHVGVAVAVDRGLLVPVVRDADTKRIGQLSAEIRGLVARCRDGSITAQELEGSVISVSNLGMFGIDRFAAIVNPPEPAILAVGRAKPTPVARGEEVVVRDVMTLTLSVDHRALYGAEGATFLGRIAELLERPGALVL